MSNNENYQIRLRGPWGYASPTGTPGSMKLPAPWAGDETQVSFSRKFNWIAELENNERVFIVFAGYTGTGEVSLNDRPLGPMTGTPAEFEITPLLQPGNMLKVDMSFDSCDPSAPRGLWGNVILEVRTSAR